MATSPMLNVRDSISKRALIGVEEIRDAIEQNRLNEDQGLVALTILMNVVNPFVTHDVSTLLAQVHQAYRSGLDQFVRETAVVDTTNLAPQTEIW